MTAWKDRPRWAKPLDEGKWRRLHELFYDGWQPAAVRRALKLPDSLKASVERYGKRYRRRRILAPLARVTELLAAETLELTPKYLELMKLALEQGVTDESKLQRTAAIVGRLFDKMLDVAAEYEKADVDRERADAEREQGPDLNEAMREMLERVGKKFDVEAA